MIYQHHISQFIVSFSCFFLSENLEMHSYGKQAVECSSMNCRKNIYTSTSK